MLLYHSSKSDSYSQTNTIQKKLTLSVYLLIPAQVACRELLHPHRPNRHYTQYPTALADISPLFHWSHLLLPPALHLSHCILDLHINHSISIICRTTANLASFPVSPLQFLGRLQYTKTGGERLGGRLVFSIFK